MIVQKSLPIIDFKEVQPEQKLKRRSFFHKSIQHSLMIKCSHIPYQSKNFNYTEEKCESMKKKAFFRPSTKIFANSRRNGFKDSNFRRSPKQCALKQLYIAT